MRKRSILRVFAVVAALVLVGQTALAQTPLTETSAEKSEMFGPGLNGGNANVVSVFTIRAVTESGNPQYVGGDNFVLHVDGPYQGVEATDVRIDDNGDGTYTARFTPVWHGDHIVRVTLDGEDVAQSPETVPIGRDPYAADPTKSWAEGVGLTDPIVYAKNHIDVYGVRPDRSPRTSGGDLFDVEITDPDGAVVRGVKIKDRNDGTYRITYRPQQSGPHEIDIFIQNPYVPERSEHLKGFPKTVFAEREFSHEKSEVTGPGLEHGILDTEPQHFIVRGYDKKGNPLDEGGSPIEVVIAGPDGQVPAEVTDNGDGTYRVDYQPEGAGDHEISVLLSGQHVADSPYDVEVDPGPFAGTSSVSHQLLFQARDRNGEPLTVGGHADLVDVEITGPGSSSFTVEDVGDGRYVVAYQLTGSGEYTIRVRLYGEDVVGSPFTIGI